MPTEKNSVEALMKACQRGVTGKGPSIEAANNLLAECYGALGKLVAENEALRKDAERYRWLRSRDLETISQGGVFAGITPQNMVLNEETLDQAVDAAMAKEAQP